MALLTRSDLHDEIDVRFPDNKTELITPPLVRAFLHNLVDSALLAASDKLSLSKALSLTQAQALLTSTPPGVEGGQYYAITGKWNKSIGSATVYVHGLSSVAYEPHGVLLAAGKYEVVAVDVAAGTTQAVAYTDAQARAAQLNQVAAPGTTLVRLAAESPTDYGTASSGTFTVDATACVVGKVVRFALAPGASAPLFTNAPAEQSFKYLGAKYLSGRAFSYSLLVCVDRIEVVLLPD